MTTIRDSVKMGEILSIVRSPDNKDVEIYYDNAENMWYIATSDREEYVLIGTDKDLDNLYDLMKHIVENIPWEEDWEPEENETES